MAPDPLHSMYSALHKTKFKFIRIIIIIQSVLTYSSSEIRSHLSKHEAFLIKCAFCSGEYGILKKKRCYVKCSEMIYEQTLLGIDYVDGSRHT